MRRRDFITLLGGATATWPLVVHAQQPAMPVIGLLSLGSAASTAMAAAAWRNGLQEAGYVENRNVKIEYRFADGQTERLPAMAADLVQRRVAVIAAGARAGLFAKQATATIPIVFVEGADPVRIGLVAALNRPGGNATGVTTMALDLEAKRLGILHELVPLAGRIAVLIDRNALELNFRVQMLETSGRSVGLPVRIVPVGDESEFDAAFATLASVGTKALMVSASSYFNLHSAAIVALSNRHGIPTMFEIRPFVEAGGLMSYGPNILDAWQKVGVYVGRILKGAKPADLPVQQPTKFEFMINLKTAKALDLKIPPNVLALADEVIE